MSASFSTPAALRPSIRYSQNFLRDPRLVAALLDTFHLARERTVCEIGPGKGIITAQLAQRCQRVIAIEQDPRLARRLRHTFADRPNVTIAEGDFLRHRLPREPYEVVANMPFNITSAIMARLTTPCGSPEVAYLTIQREAAEMYLGQPHESLRTILMQPWFEFAVVHRFQRTDFAPVPRVDVVMVRLRKRGPPLVPRAQSQRFRDFVTHLFTAWQPTVEYTLNHLCGARQLKVLRATLNGSLAMAPTSMTLDQWLALFAAFQAIAGPRALAALAGSERRLHQQQRLLQKIHRTRTR